MSPPELIIWRDAFSTGDQSIDHEHQQLIHLVNDVATQISDNPESDAVVDALGEVFARISAHFALEESIMRRMKYHDYNDHKEDHEFLLDDIRDIMDSYENRVFSDAPKVFINRLNDWFLGHFATHDARLHKVIHKPE